MSPHTPRQAERTAGPFLGPDLLVPTPLRTLSDDYRDVPAEPEDSEREPEPDPPGLVHRFIERLERQLRRGR